LGSNGFRLDFFWTQRKILNQIKPKNIKIGQYFHFKVKKEPEFRMAATRRNLLLGSKIKTNPSKTNLQASFQKGVDKIYHLNSHEIEADGSSMEFFFLKIGFSSIKSPNSSRESIFLETTKSILV
jgi:hypothetical protein